MWVCGIDYSTRAVDVVCIDYDGDKPPKWARLTLQGADAFERSRDVANAMFSRNSDWWSDKVAVGIEHPAGKFGTGTMLRIQGAILACIPARMLVEPLPPAKWRKLVGLAGNASKEDVMAFVMHRKWEQIPWRDGRLNQDQCDAFCIALATRTLLLKEKAA